MIDFEQVSFTIWDYRDACRIVANDCRAEIRNLTDEACISDMTVLMDEMNRINEELYKMRAYPVYTFRNRNGIL